MDGHIPGAVFFDIDAIADRSTDLPHMLPDEAAFAAAAGALGLSETDTIVVYDGAGLFSAPRVWWTLTDLRGDGCACPRRRPAGLEAVGFPLQAARLSPQPATFHAALERDAVRSFDEVAPRRSKRATRRSSTRARRRGSAAKLPSRGPDSLRAICRAPAICPSTAGGWPGPAASAGEIRAVVPRCWRRSFTSRRNDLRLRRDGRIASLRARRFGKEDVALYDGSWAEWASRSGRCDRQGTGMTAEDRRHRRSPILSMPRAAAGVAADAGRPAPGADEGGERSRCISTVTSTPRSAGTGCGSSGCLSTTRRCRARCTGSGVEIFVLYANGAPGRLLRARLRATSAHQPGLFRPDAGMDRPRDRPVAARLRGLPKAFSRGAEEMTVNTCTLDHPAALPLYQRLGFRPVGARSAALQSRTHVEHSRPYCRPLCRPEVGTIAGEVRWAATEGAWSRGFSHEISLIAAGGSRLPVCDELPALALDKAARSARTVS